MHNFDIKSMTEKRVRIICTWNKFLNTIHASYLTVHRPISNSQLRTCTSQHTKALEHTSHIAYIKDSFSISSSSVMDYLLFWPSIKGNNGLAVSGINEANICFWRRQKEHPLQENSLTRRRRLSYDVALTGRHADWPHILMIPGIHIPHRAYINTRRPQRPPTDQRPLHWPTHCNNSHVA